MRSSRSERWDHQAGAVLTKTIKSSGGTAPTERIILGIDPGTTVMGFGVLLVEGGKARLLDAGAIRFRPEDDHTLKLRAIFQHTIAIINEHHPDELAIEAQFFGKNVQSMLKLGRAQGVAIAAALHRDLSVVEYAPKRVKQSITGNGNATKEQVAAMLLSILGITELPQSTDATDAIAVAVCHHFSHGSVMRSTSRSSARGSSDWGNFVKNNPSRVKKC
jgi:crossover junction endodeoxyribonuclease RuvC